MKKSFWHKLVTILLYLPIATAFAALAFFIPALINGGITLLADHIPLGGFEYVIAVPFRFILAGIPGYALSCLAIVLPSNYLVWRTRHMIVAILMILPAEIIVAGIGAWLLAGLFEEGVRIDVFALLTTYVPPFLALLVSFFTVPESLVSNSAMRA